MICERCQTEIAVGDFPFCRGNPEDHQRGTSVVQGDECDFIQHNGTRTPIRFRSKAAFRDWRKANHYEIRDSHVPLPGTDRSPHTTNWGNRMDPYTANNVRILLERAFRAKPSKEDEPLDMHITTYTGELTREEAKKYVERNGR